MNIKKSVTEMFDEAMNDDDSHFYSKMLNIFETICSDPEPNIPDEFFTRMDQSTRKLFITAFCVFIKKEADMQTLYEGLFTLLGRAQREKQGV